MLHAHSEKLLLFKEDTKQIYLNHQRMVLMPTDSLGTLRKELISALGMERAKAFLLRFGWNYGVNNAITLKPLFPYTTDDWLKFGPQFHELTGQVLVKAKTVYYDKETEDYFAEGYWYYSYEAEEHIKHFGFHHEPVCFTLVGFAGGYVSTHLGKRVLFKEVECIGKGDPYCHWIAKKVEDWGEEMAGETHFYEVENLAQELDRAYQRIESQKEMLKKVLSINSELTRALLRREGLPSLLQILGQHLKVPVIVEDQHFNLMETYQYNYNCLMIAFVRETTSPKQRENIHKLIHQKRTVHLSIPKQYGWQHERLVSPIIVNNQILGYISLIKKDGQFDELELIALERASTICSIYFLNEQIAIETEQKIKGDFLDELLNETKNMEHMVQRMKLFGYDLNKPHYIFLFHLEQQEKGERHKQETDLINLRKKMAETIYQHMQSQGKTCLVSIKLNQIIALVPADIMDNKRKSIKDFGKKLITILKHTYPQSKIRLGISALCHQLTDYKRRYDEVRKIVEMSKRVHHHSDVIFFEEIGLIPKICNENNMHELRSLAYEKLDALIRYDTKHNTNFLQTLYHYLNSQGNILKTSKALMLSPGAVKYRLKRIQEIGNIDVEKDFIDLYVAFQILIFLGELDI